MVLTREKLLDVVWGFDYYGESRTVDVHVNHLRDKIAGSDVHIETIRGIGYKMIEKTQACSGSEICSPSKGEAPSIEGH